MIFTAQVRIRTEFCTTSSIEGYVHTFEASSFDDAFNSVAVRKVISYYKGCNITILLLEFSTGNEGHQLRDVNGKIIPFGYNTVYK